MRRLSVRWRAVLAVALLSVVSACGAGAAEPDGDAGPPKAGGTLTYLLSGEVPSLDPVTFTVPSNPSFLAPRALAIFDSLAVENPETGEMQMRLAESIASPDGLVWTAKLKPDLKFSDNTPLDAEALRFNWQRIADPANRAAMAPYAQQMASMDVVDAVTLKVTLKAPNVAFNRVISRYLTYIGSPTAIRERGKDFGDKPVGAGAYQVEEFVRDDHLTLVRNPYYKGSTYLDRIIIKPVVDEAQRLNTLASDGADAMFSSDQNSAAQAKDFGAETVTTTLNGGSDIMFNVTKAPFDDKRARQAIALALDPAALNRDLYDGQGTPVDTLFVDSSPFHDASIKQRKPDPAKAQDLFDELAADGKPLDVTFLVPQSFTSRAEWFQAQLAKFENVKVSLQSLPDAQVPATGKAGNFQAAFLTSSWLYPSPSLQTFFGTGATQNWGRYSNPKVDQALNTGLTSQDEAVQVEAYKTVQRAIVDDIPSVFYARPKYLVIHNAKVHGVTVVGDGSPLWTDLWMS